MPKKNVLKKYDALHDFDGSDESDPSYDEAMTGVMHGLIEASNNHMTLAIELTKLAVEKHSSKEMNEDEVFSIFKKASEVIADSFPLKALWEKFSENN